MHLTSLHTMWPEMAADARATGMHASVEKVTWLAAAVRLARLEFSNKFKIT